MKAIERQLFTTNNVLTSFYINLRIEHTFVRLNDSILKGNGEGEESLEFQKYCRRLTKNLVVDKEST